MYFLQCSFKRMSIMDEMQQVKLQNIRCFSDLQAVEVTEMVGFLQFTPSRKENFGSR